MINHADLGDNFSSFSFIYYNLQITHGSLLLSGLCVLRFVP